MIINNKNIEQYEKEFKCRQILRWKKTINPSFWLKIKLKFWVLYWKLFMPKNCGINVLGFSDYFYIEHPHKGKKTLPLEGLKETKKSIIRFTEENADLHI